MKGKTRRKLEMGIRALEFSRDHPDPSPGYANAVEQLQDCVIRARELLDQQREGLARVHASAERKRTLRRDLRRAHLAHLLSIARMAERELPGLAAKFRLDRGTIPYLVFRNAARRMAAEAVTRQEVMVRYGLAGSILESLMQLLQEFDGAVAEGIDGRHAHVEASAGLDEAGNEAVRIVKGLDCLNRHRLEQQPGMLAGWTSSSNVIATSRSVAAEVPEVADGSPAA